MCGRGRAAAPTSGSSGDRTEPPMTTSGIRIAIVEDHPVVREGTAAILAAQPGLNVVGTAGSLTEARALLARV